jgi:predicted RNase H-like nuclease
MSVIGIDACPTGWVGIALAEDTKPVAVWATTIEQLIAQVDHVAIAAIDIPIGLPASAPRVADLEARKAVGVLRSSVFPTPIRPAIESETYAKANAISRTVAGVGLSRQAYGLRTKILEIDSWVQGTPLDVREVHPEVSFATLAGETLTTKKKSWAGACERRTLLAAAGIELDDDLGTAGTYAGYDDVLDAAAAVWTALRILKGQAVSFPATPETDGRTGRPIAIWA